MDYANTVGPRSGLVSMSRDTACRVSIVKKRDFETDNNVRKETDTFPINSKIAMALISGKAFELCVCVSDVHGCEWIIIPFTSLWIWIKKFVLM